MRQPLLFQRYPSLGSLPWISLASLPTPVEPLAIDGARFLIKRDDLTSAAYGGNKVRKLEFVLGRAQAIGARRVITAGAAGSHHALATTWFARQVGLPVTLVLFPQPLTDHVREVLLTDAALGADLTFVARMTAVPLGITMSRLARFRDRPMVIAPGGSDAFGTLGYVNAMIELADQLAQPPDLILVAAGTMGTVAGIALGAELLGWPTRIAGVRITSRLVTNERVLAGLIRGCGRLLGERGVQADLDRAFSRVELVHSQLGLGYGLGTPAAEAARAAFKQADIELDVTYTAKAAADLLQRACGDQSILYWHTLSRTMPAVPLAPVDTLPEPFRAYLEQANAT